MTLYQTTVAKILQDAGRMIAALDASRALVDECEDLAKRLNNTGLITASACITPHETSSTIVIYVYFTTLKKIMQAAREIGLVTRKIEDVPDSHKNKTVRIRFAGTRIAIEAGELIEETQEAVCLH